MVCEAGCGNGTCRAAGGRLRECALLSRALPGRSDAARATRRFILHVAGVELPILLQGETGTGKTLLARWIHRFSGRGRGPFLSVNAAALPDGLFESELFGHRRGAFSGAIRDRRGLFVSASGGTLLLDEIGDLPPGQQAKLLTVLDDWRVRPLGGNEEVPIDVRLMTATSVPLREAVTEGRFRSDLHYRIALLRWTLPPLRERLADLPLLAEMFLQRFSQRHGTGLPTLDRKALSLLEAHPWPGNLRELAHLLEAATVLLGGGPLPVSGLRALLDDEPMTAFPFSRAAPPSSAASRPSPRPANPLADPERISREEHPSLPEPSSALRDPSLPPQGTGEARKGECEYTRIMRVVEENGGNLARASRVLGIPRSTLRRKVLRHEAGRHIDDQA